MMLATTRAFALATILSLPLHAFAEDDSPALYDDLGGETVMTQVVSDMLARSLADPRMAPIFADSNLERLEGLLNVHICYLADGPCTYEGQHMRRAHDGLGIRTIHFNLLVEDLQEAMDAQDIPFRTQNKLLARLAPFHDDVTERSPVPPRQSKPTPPDSGG